MELNESQLKATNHQGEHLLVLAGAGTGKTRTIISRGSFLIEKGVAPERILILTFTKKAAFEILSRIEFSSNSNLKKPLSSTFHSWCNKLIFNYPNLFGTKSYTVIDQADQIGLMKIICGNKNVVFDKIQIKPKSIIDIFSYARNTRKNLSDSIAHKLFNNDINEDTKKIIQELRSVLEELIKAYVKKKEERKYLDYDDILIIVAQRLNKDNVAREKICSLYDHILIDEFQDTNPLQWALLRPFLSYSKLFCVGDDAQSIYGFRGADFKNIHLFKERVPDSDIIRLSYNYRSTQEILDLSNWLLSKSKLDYEKELISNRGKGNKPKLISFSDSWIEGRWIADKIIENFNDGKNYSDHLILSRSQFYTSQLQAVLLEKGIPYVVYGGMKFLESAHIRDFLSVLRIVNNFKDEIAWIRFLTLWEGIGNVTASKYISEIIDLTDITEVLNHLKLFGDSKVQILLSIIEKTHNLQGNLSECLKNLYHSIEETLKAKYDVDWNEKRSKDFPIIIELGANFETLNEFINECVIDDPTSINNAPNFKVAQLQKSSSQDKVVISTIHSAKGLEASECFVLDVSPGSFPIKWTLEKEDEVEEERRVLYVALTRAKDNLYITRKNLAFSAIKDEVETYFLNDLNNELVDLEFQKLVNNTIGGDLAEDNNEFDTLEGMDFS